MKNISVRKKNCTKKAQLEMIGLMVIVIIVIIALLIFTVYKMTTPQKSTQKRYVNQEIATNMLISMTKVHVTECYNHRLADLIIDCARRHQHILCPKEEKSCVVANRTLYNMVNQTLIKWNMSFNLSIEKTNITLVNLHCTPRTVGRVQGFEILPLDPGHIEMTLAICPS